MKRMKEVLEDRPMCHHHWAWDGYEFYQDKGVITTYFHNLVCEKCGVKGGVSCEPGCMWCGEYPCNCCQKCPEEGPYHTRSGKFLCKCVEVTE